MKLALIILFSGILLSCSTINIEELTPKTEPPSINKTTKIILIPNSSSYLELKLGERLMDQTDYDTTEILGQRSPTSSQYILHTSKNVSKVIAESAFTKQWEQQLDTNLQIQTSDEGHIFLKEDVSDALPATRNILLLKRGATEYEVRYLQLGYGEAPKYGYPLPNSMILLNHKKAIVGDKAVEIDNIPYMHTPFSSEG